jgi:hypothetical protein
MSRRPLKIDPPTSSFNSNVASIPRRNSAAAGALAHRGTHAFASAFASQVRETPVFRSIR